MCQISMNPGDKYLTKSIFDIKIEIVHIRNNEYVKFQLSLSFFNFGTNLRLIGGKYFIIILTLK